MRRAWAAALACLGGCVVDGEVCATRHDVPVPGVTGADRIDVAFDVELPSEVRVDRVRFRAASGIADLAWVEAAEISIAGAAVGGCHAGCGDGPEVEVPIALVAEDQLAGGASITGAIPPTPWTVDIEVCASTPDAFDVASRW